MVAVHELINAGIVLQPVEFLLDCNKLVGGALGDVAEIPADRLNDVDHFRFSLDFRHGADHFQRVVNKVGSDLGLQRAVFVFQNLQFRVAPHPLLFHQLRHQL